MSNIEFWMKLKWLAIMFIISLFSFATYLPCFLIIQGEYLIPSPHIFLVFQTLFNDN
jgi:hypothetical protein